MKSLNSSRLILLHPFLPKHSIGASIATHHRIWVVAFISFSAFTFLLTLLTSSAAHRNTPRPAKPPLGPPPDPARASGLDRGVFDTLVHYAAQSAAVGRMSEGDLRSIAAVIRRRAPCNFLVFGLGPETLLWQALNQGGRTVFVDENQYYISRYEERHPGLEGYDVAYTTKVSQMAELLAAVRAQLDGDCRPVQNLLFSDCLLGINDLPNQLYDVGWDVVLVDGPRGYAPESPGRMSTIFTAAVLARSAGEGPTDVLVHDYDRDVERICSLEFLCAENLVSADAQLAHFTVRGGVAARKDVFCFNRTAAAAATS